MVDAQKHIVAIILLLLLLLKMITWAKNTNILKSLDLLLQVGSRDTNKIWKKEQWMRGEILASSFRTSCGDPRQVSFLICTSYYLSLIMNELDLLSKVPLNSIINVSMVSIQLELKWICKYDSSYIPFLEFDCA